MSKITAVVPKLTQVCLRQSAQRGISNSPKLSQERVSLDKVKALQKKFQVDDGTPVYLKGGPLDRVLFGTTVALCVLGVTYGTTVVYKLAVPPSN